MSMRLGPGDALTDYELPDHESVPRKLSEIQGDDPMILTLARGHYCPKEHQQHSAPGLREAWDAEDHSRFHGWNRR